MYSIQKKVGYLFFITGIAVVTANMVTISRLYGFTSAMGDISVYLTLIFSFYSLFTIFIDSKVIRFSQILVLCLVAGISIIDQYDSFYGVGLLFLSVILAFKYRFFERKAVLKLMCIGIYTFTLIEVSVAVNDDFVSVIHGFDSLVFLTLMIVFFLMLYRDEIRSYLEKQNRFSSEIDSLKREHALLQNRINQDSLRLAELNEKIREYTEENKPIDLKALQVSPAEERVVRTLCTYRCDNREIAKRLNISVPTVKVHLSRVMDKLGVDDRYAVMDMCRNNFST